MRGDGVTLIAITGQMFPIIKAACGRLLQLPGPVS